MRTTNRLALAGAVAIVLASCGSDGDDPSGDDSGEGGGTVHTSMGDPGTFLTAEAHSFDNLRILDNVFSGLVRYDPETTEPYNYLAEEITTEDSTTWTITIKEGWTFQNGEPVDAESFKRAWDFAAYGPNGYYNSFFFNRIAGYDDMQAEEEGAEPAADELAGVRVVDDYTLEVELSSPFGAFSTILGYAGFFPMAQECLDDIEQCAVEPIGNGPFQFDGEWQPELGVTLTQWDDYAGEEKPSVDSVEFTAYLGDDVSWPDFLTGDIDISEPPPAEWEAAMNDPDMSQRVVTQEGTALTYLGFPLYDKTFQDVNLRRSFSLAIDMEAITSTVVPGRYVPADSWAASGVPGGGPGTCEYCRFDPEEAADLLEQAGGWPEDKVLTISYGADPTSEAIFKAIGDQLKQNLGIEYQLDPLEDFFDKRSNKDFAGGVFRNNWYPDYPLNENYLAPSYAGGPDGNHWGWDNPAFDAKLAEADQALDPDEAIALYQEAEQIIAEDMVTIPLTWTQSTTFYSERVDNVVLNPFSGAVELRLIEVVE